MEGESKIYPGYHWEISVDAGSYFESMAQSFGGNDLGFSSLDESHTGKVFLAYSYHADQLPDPGLAGRRIFSLQLLMNGALRVEVGNLSLRPMEFTEFHDGRSVHKVDPSSIEENPFSNVPFIDQDLSGFRNPKRDGTSHLIFLAKTDEVIRTVLFLAGMIATYTPLLRILSWSTLFKILDTLKHGCRLHGWDVADLGSEDDVERFTAACNNASILGLEARHGLSGRQPPTRIMRDFDEAAVLILTMARKYVEKFVSRPQANPPTGG